MSGRGNGVGQHAGRSGGNVGRHSGGRGGRGQENGTAPQQQRQEQPGVAAAAKTTTGGWGAGNFANVLKQVPKTAEGEQKSTGDAASGASNGLQFGSFTTHEAPRDISAAPAASMETATSGTSAAAPVPTPVTQPLPHAVAAPQQAASLPVQNMSAAIPAEHGPRSGQGQGPRGQSMSHGMPQAGPQSSRVGNGSNMPMGGRQHQATYNRQQPQQPNMHPHMQPQQGAHPGGQQAMMMPYPGSYQGHMIMSMPPNFGSMVPPMSPPNPSFIPTSYAHNQIPMQMSGMQPMPMQGMQMGNMGMHAPPPPPPMQQQHMQQQMQHQMMGGMMAQPPPPHQQHQGPMSGLAPLNHSGSAPPPPPPQQHHALPNAGAHGGLPYTGPAPTAPVKRVLKIVNPSSKQTVTLPDKAVSADKPAPAVRPQPAAGPAPALAAVLPASVAVAASSSRKGPASFPPVPAQRVTRGLAIREPTEQEKEEAEAKRRARLAKTPTASVAAVAPVSVSEPPAAAAKTPVPPPASVTTARPAAPVIAAPPSNEIPKSAMVATASPVLAAAVMAGETPVKAVTPVVEAAVVAPAAPEAVVVHEAAPAVVAAAPAAVPEAAAPAVALASSATAIVEAVSGPVVAAAPIVEAPEQEKAPALKAGHEELSPLAAVQVEADPAPAAAVEAVPALIVEAAPAPPSAPAPAAEATPATPAAVAAPAPVDEATPAPAAVVEVAPAPTAASEPAPVSAAAAEVAPASTTATEAAPVLAAAAEEAPAPITAAETVAVEEAVQVAAATDAASTAEYSKKKSIKEIGKLADARDELLRDRADPFAKPKAHVPVPAKLFSKTEEGSVAAEAVNRQETVDDWETADDTGTAVHRQAAPAAPAEPEPAEDGRHTYTRDFMKSLATLHTSRPASLAAIERELTEFLLAEARPFNPENYSDTMRSGGMGRGGAAPRGGRPGDEWASGGGRGPGGPGAPGGGGRGGQFADPRGGPAAGRGAMGPGGREAPRRGAAPPVMDDKWERGRALPQQQADSRGGGGGDRRGGGGGMRGGPAGVLPSLHRTDNRFVAGQLLHSEDPDEEKKQKAYQGILNKITPDNFERLTQKMLEEVGVTEQRSLEGLIDKIFDKALTDTHFSELYASMCREVSNHPLCPKFESASGGKPVDLRRLLLNKCQEEFERGCRAMASVAEREAKGEDIVEGDDKHEEKEEGELEEVAKAEAAEGAEEVRIVVALTPAEEEKAQRLALRKAALEDRNARQRMLGNIQFVSYLYKMTLLTERIIHSCITQLLKEEANPRAEDVECLCKLLSTVGAQLDSTSKAEHKAAMQVYFKRMQALKINEKLDSRIRFMVQDVLELRAAKWVPRTKKEGPKKIADVHREAERELQMQAQRDREEQRRGPDRRGGGGGGGGRRDEPPRRDANFDRMLSRDEVPNRPMQMQRNAPTQEVSLRPGGRAGGPSARTASPSMPASSAGSRRAEPAAAPPAERPVLRLDAPSASKNAPAAAEATISDDSTKISVESSVTAFFHVHGQSVPLLLASLGELRARGGNMSLVVKLVLKAALETRGKSLEERVTPFQEVFQATLEAGPEENGLSAQEFEAGTAAFVRELHQVEEEIPLAPKSLAPMFGLFVAAGNLSLASVLGCVLEVEPEDEGGDAPLVDVGSASKWMFALMTKIVELKGLEAATQLWANSGLDATKFFASVVTPEEQRTAVDTATLTFLLGP